MKPPNGCRICKKSVHEFYIFKILQLEMQNNSTKWFEKGLWLGSFDASLSSGPILPLFSFEKFCVGWVLWQSFCPGWYPSEIFKTKFSLPSRYVQFQEWLSIFRLFELNRGGKHFQWSGKNESVTMNKCGPSQENSSGQFSFCLNWSGDSFIFQISIFVFLSL